MNSEHYFFHIMDTQVLAFSVDIKKCRFRQFLVCICLDDDDDDINWLVTFV